MGINRRKWNEVRDTWSSRHWMRRIACFFVALALCVSMLPMSAEQTQAAVRSGNVIYTSFKGGNESHTGDGSRSNPYNLFIDAYEKAADGDTIMIVGEAGAFLNAYSEKEPFVIEKSITICGEDQVNGSVFSSRMAGIVLDADVTFSHVRLHISNRCHDAIFANGHKLTLEHVNSDSSFRYVDIFGGPLYVGGKVVGTKPGSNAKIVIQNGGANLGNLYAGAMNGSYTGSTTITLEQVNGTQNGAIYLNGAEEASVDMDSFLDVREPEPPKANAAYTVSGNVSVSLKNCDMRTVEQLSGSDALKTSLTIDTDKQYVRTPAVKNVASLTVQGGGTFAPTEISASCQVTLQGSSALDVSQLSKPMLASVTSTGAGENRLILDKEQTLELSDTLSGVLRLETSGGKDGKSGTAKYGHTYLTVGKAAAGTVSFTPSEGQPTMELEAGEDGKSWRTSEVRMVDDISVDGVQVTNPVLTVTREELRDASASFWTAVIWSEDIPEDFRYLTNVPIDYTVKFNNQVYKARQVEENEDFFIAIPELGLMFETSMYEDDGIAVLRYNNGQDTLPAAGRYDITISPLSEREPIECEVVLIIRDDAGNESQPKETATTVQLSTNTVVCGDSIDVSGAVSYSDGSGVPNGLVAVYVNQKKVSTDSLNPDGTYTLSLQASEENGFCLDEQGKNEILVIYMDETGVADSSQASATLTVTPISYELKVTAQQIQSVVYNGKAQSYQIERVDVIRTDTQKIVASNVTPHVTYQQNGQQAAPVLPGTYDVAVAVTEPLYGTLSQQTGTLKITSATPTVTLTVQKAAADGTALFHVAVKGSSFGTEPVGYVLLSQGEAKLEIKEKLCFGEAEVSVFGLENEHTYTFQAKYEPSYKNVTPHYVTAESASQTVTIPPANIGTKPDGDGGSSTPGQKPDGDSGSSTPGQNPGGGGSSMPSQTPGGSGSASGGGSSGGGASGGSSSTGGNNSAGSSKPEQPEKEPSKGETDSANKNDAAEQPKPSTHTPSISINASESNKKDQIKAKVSLALVQQAVADNEGSHTDLTIKVQDKKGDTSYTLTVNTADVVAGKSLYLCAIDPKTGAYTLVNSKRYKLSGKGNLNISAPAEKDYVLLNRSDMNKVSAQIKKTVALKNKKVQTTAGKKTRLKFAKSLNMDNVKSISYINLDKSIVSVSKNGVVRGKKKGTGKVNVEVTLNNGQVKLLKAKIVIK